MNKYSGMSKKRIAKNKAIGLANAMKRIEQLEEKS
jgi:hypothetical protein